MQRRRALSAGTGQRDHAGGAKPVLDKPSLSLQLDGRARSRRTLGDEKPFPVQLDGQLVEARDRALFERLQGGPEVRRVLDRPPDGISMPRTTSTAAAGAPIVAGCRRR